MFPSATRQRGACSLEEQCDSRRRGASSNRKDLHSGRRAGHQFPGIRLAHTEGQLKIFAIRERPAETFLSWQMPGDVGVNRQTVAIDLNSNRARFGDVEQIRSETIAEVEHATQFDGGMQRLGFGNPRTK